jgi:competence protein ComEC
MVASPEPRLVQSPLLVLAIAFGAGVASAHFFKLQSKAVLIISVMVCGALTFISLLLRVRDKASLRTAVLIGAYLFAGLILASIEGRPGASNRITRLFDDGRVNYDEPVELTGVVQGQPEPAPDSFYLTVRTQRIRVKGTELTASGTVLLLMHVRGPQIVAEYESLGLRHGARIRVMTVLERDENFRNPGVMSLTEYLEREGYEATGVVKSPLLIERLDDEAVFLPLAWVYEWREQMQREFAATFSAETAGVLEAALLGNRYNISKSAAERFRAGGTFHVLVISGLQIAFIGGLVVLLTRAVTRNKLLQFSFATLFMWAYSIGVGADPSVARSAVMFTIALLAPVLWRQANSLNVIGGAALALLVWQPQGLFDPSFQLTFLSVLAIVLMAVPFMQNMQRVGAWRPTRATPYPPLCPGWFRTLSEILFWSEREWRAEMAASHIKYRLFKTPIAARLESWHIQRPLRFASAAIVVSASVQLGLLPLMVIYFHRLSIASLALNIFVGVLMAALAFAGLAAIVLAHLNVRWATPLVLLAEKINWLMIHLVDPFSRFGLASIRLPHYPGWRGVVYLLYYLLLGFLVFALGRWEPMRPAAARRVFWRSKVLGAAGAFVAVLSLIVLHPFSSGRPDGRLHIDFLDVGQGDAALLTMPDGTTLLVDGGGRPNINHSNDLDTDEEEVFERDARSIGENVVSQFLWSRGLDKVDYLLATHADADHIDGLNDVARNFHVLGSFVARTPSDDPEYLRFAMTMKEAGVPVVKIGAGDVLNLGPVSAQVLWPPASNDGAAPSRNNDSLMMLIRYGEKRFLMTGDIEKEGEAAVLNEPLDLRSDLVKVAHHGSKTSSTAGIVAATRPSLAIISVGRTSMFGHPNKDVVERWRASGAQVMTTGQKGTISITSDGHTLAVETFVK